MRNGTRGGLARATKVLCLATLVVAWLATEARSDLNAGLVANWNFDACTAADSSGNNLNGIIAGAPACVPGVVGTAFSFDGVDDYFEVADAPPLRRIPESYAFTVASWINIRGWAHDSFGGWFNVVDKYHSAGDFGWIVYAHRANESLVLQTSGGDAGCPFVAPLNEWLHLAVTFDGVDATFYVNGSSVCRAGASPNLGATGPLYVGYSPSGGDEYPNGLLDELRLYDRALGPTEVRELFAGCEGALCLSRMSPSRGGDTGSVTAAIVGQGLVSESVVRLIRAGQPDIVGLVSAVNADGTVLTVTFDLNSHARGEWDVVVENGGSAVTLAHGFTVEEGTPPSLWVDILGQGAARIGRTQRYWLVVGNRGNVDVPRAHVVVGASANVSVTAAQTTVLQSGGHLHIALIDLPAAGVRHIPLSATANGGAAFALAAGASISLGDLLEERSRRPTTAAAATQSSQSRSLDAAAQPQDSAAYDATYPNTTSGCGGAPAGYLCTYYIVDPLGVAHGTQQAMSMGDGTVRWSVGGPVKGTTTTSIAEIENADWGEFGPPLTRLRDMGADRPYYGYGLRTDGTMVPLAELSALARQATDDLVREKIPFADPSLYDPDVPGSKISCVDFYYTGYDGDRDDSLLDLMRDSGMVVVDWSASFRPLEGLDNDTLRAEFQRRNAIPIAYESATFSVPAQYFSVEQRVGVVQSFDPNTKVGSSGSGGPRFYISGEEPLRYVIHFENVSSATAPAQEVAVVDDLNPAIIDLSTFAFGPVAFGDEFVELPVGHDFEVTVDLRPEKHLSVRVRARLDETTGRVEWRFASLDPTTGLPIDDPLAGFLPPNVNPPEGDGSVVFTVSPQPGLPTGTQITNQASIVFDTNEPILTPVWLNTINQPRCAPAPDAGCRRTPAGASTLKLRDQLDDTKDVFGWKWNKGDATTLVDFRDPIRSFNDYRVCVYDASARPQPLLESEIFPGENCGNERCWKEAGATGLKYKSKLGVPDGMTGLAMKGGVSGKAKLQVKGKGANLGLPSLPLTGPVTVQFLVNDGRSRECWETVFTAPAKNEAGKFEAKGP